MSEGIYKWWACDQSTQVRNTVRQRESETSISQTSQIDPIRLKRKAKCKKKREVSKVQSLSKVINQRHSGEIGHKIQNYPLFTVIILSKTLFLNIIS